MLIDSMHKDTSGQISLVADMSTDEIMNSLDTS